MKQMFWSCNHRDLFYTTTPPPKEDLALNRRSTWFPGTSALHGPAAQLTREELALILSCLRH